MPSRPSPACPALGLVRLVGLHRGGLVQHRLTAALTRSPNDSVFGSVFPVSPYDEAPTAAAVPAAAAPATRRAGCPACSEPDRSGLAGGRRREPAGPAAAAAAARGAAPAAGPDAALPDRAGRGWRRLDWPLCRAVLACPLLAVAAGRGAGTTVGGRSGRWRWTASRPAMAAGSWSCPPHLRAMSASRGWSSVTPPGRLRRLRR